MQQPPATPPLAYRWVLMGGLVLCSWGILWYGFTLGVLLPDMSDDLGIGSAAQGWLSSSFFLGQVVFSLPVTALLARLPPLRTMGIAYALGAVLIAVAALIPSYWVQLAMRLGVALVFVAMNPVRTMVLAGWFHRDEIPRANSVFNAGFGSVQTLGFWTSGALLGLLGGWRPLTVLFVVFAAAGALAWALVARAAPPPTTPLASTTGAGRGRSWLALFGRRDVLSLCLIGVGGAGTWAVYLTFWPQVARDEFGLGDGATGLVLGCAAVAIIPGSLAAAWVLRVVGGRLPFLLITTLAQVPTFAVFVLTGSIPLLIAVGFVQGLTWMYFPILLSVPFEFEGFDEQDVAIATGLFVVVNGAALALGPLAAGLAGEWLSMRTVLLVAAIAPLLSALGALLLGPEPARGRPAPSTEGAAAPAQ
jgi:DHA1 family inner membrane transport protein